MCAWRPLADTLDASQRLKLRTQSVGDEAQYCEHGHDLLLRGTVLLNSDVVRVDGLGQVVIGQVASRNHPQDVVVTVQAGDGGLASVGVLGDMLVVWRTSEAINLNGVRVLRSVQRELSNGGATIGSIGSDALVFQMDLPCEEVAFTLIILTSCQLSFLPAMGV